MVSSGAFNKQNESYFSSQLNVDMCLLLKFFAYSMAHFSESKGDVIQKFPSPSRITHRHLSLGADITNDKEPSLEQYRPSLNHVRTLFSITPASDSPEQASGKY